MYFSQAVTCSSCYIHMYSHVESRRHTARISTMSETVTVMDNRKQTRLQARPRAGLDVLRRIKSKLHLFSANAALTLLNTFPLHSEGGTHIGSLHILFRDQYAHRVCQPWEPPVAYYISRLCSASDAAVADASAFRLKRGVLLLILGVHTCATVTCPTVT